MVGVEVESDMFHWRERCFLEPCLSTTPQIKSKNGAGLPKPNLKSAAQLLRMIMDESKKVSFYLEIDKAVRILNYATLLIQNWLVTWFFPNFSHLNFARELI